MSTDHVEQPWAIRSTLIAVADLDRSIAFYRELGPFAEIGRGDAVALVGGVSPSSIVLILRETQGIHTRHGQQSLGLRSISFNVGSLAELDRIESVLRGRDLFTTRRRVDEGAVGTRRREGPGQPASGVRLLHPRRDARTGLLPSHCQPGVFARRLTRPTGAHGGGTDRFGETGR